MSDKKNFRYKPLYKKTIKLNVNLNNNNKIFKLKKKKWKTFPVQLKETVTNIQKFLSLLESYFQVKDLELEETFERRKKKRTIIKPIPNFNYADYIIAKFASRGNSFRKKFKKNLIEKKIFNYFYGGLTRKYLKKHMTFIHNIKTKKDSNMKQICLEFFESRLDAVLYRAKFCSNTKNARQLISHQNILVNGKIQNNKFYILKPGDVIKVKTGSFEYIRKNLQKMETPIETTTILNTLINNIPEKNSFSYIADNFEKVETSIKTNVVLNKLVNSILAKQSIETILPVWPIPPSYLIINYKTLEIIFGGTANYNFSAYFSLKLNIDSIVINCYRH